MTNKGFSIYEVMVVMVLTGMVIGMLSSHYRGMKHLIDTFNEQVAFKEQYLIFLLKFEEDYQTADNFSESDLNNLDQLVFIRDLNLDGDYLDSAEQITYRWSSSKQFVDRKSGKGGFQELLGGVQEFRWGRTSNKPLCHSLTLTDSLRKSARETLFCRSAPVLK